MADTCARVSRQNLVKIEINAPKTATASAILRESVSNVKKPKITLVCTQSMSTNEHVVLFRIRHECISAGEAELTARG